MKITLTDRIKTALLVYILFNLFLFLLAAVLVYGYLELNSAYLSDIGGLILIAIFSFIYILSIIITYFLNQKFVPLLLKIHPIFLIFFYLLSYSYANSRASEGVLLYWFLLSPLLVFVILIHYVIIVILGKKKGWLIEN